MMPVVCTALQRIPDTGRDREDDASKETKLAKE